MFRRIYRTIIVPRRLAIVFVMCSASAGLANAISRYLFFFVFDYTVSVTLAYILAMLVAFVLFKFTVFKVKSREGLLKEVFAFIMVNMIGLVQTLIVSVLLAEHLFPRIGFTFRPYDVAHFIGIMVPVVTSYFLHKHITFTKR